MRAPRGPHLLDRPGAPPLSALWASASWLVLGVGALCASVVARRERGARPAVAAGVIAALSAAHGGTILVLKRILGFPFGA